VRVRNQLVFLAVQQQHRRLDVLDPLGIVPAVEDEGRHAPSDVLRGLFDGREGTL
jgi:hypothetical protein